MGLRFRKSVSLGKGVRLNLGKKGASISGGVKGFRVGVGPKGIRTSASIPGTGLSYSKNHSFKKLKKLANKEGSSKPQLVVLERNQITKILSNEAPKEIRSNYYPIQSALGGLGILCIFGSFLQPLLLLVGALLIAGKLYWRKKTDPTVVHYKNISTYFRSEKYDKCIESIEYVLQHPEGDQRLKLILAECYLSLNDSSKAYEVYHSFFSEHLHHMENGPEYWSPRVNVIFLSLENKDIDFALKIAETLYDTSMDEAENNLWKNYLKGLCFMKMQEYDAALHSFQDAVGRKRSMEEPYIDAHYQMGIAYSKTGKNSLAKKRFTRVYSANTGYKQIAEIIETINAGRNILDLL